MFGGALLASPPAVAGCVAPRAVGVSLSAARRVIQESGCTVTVRELPARSGFVSPEQPDPRQLVARQSPAAGSRAAAVTIWLKPLCAQPAAPGPPPGSGPSVRTGPTELVAGLFVQGGPLLPSPECRAGTSTAGTVTVLTTAGRVLAQRTVRAGRLAVFPLAPGSYELQGTFAGAAAPTAPQRFTILARHTTRRNVVEDVP